MAGDIGQLHGNWNSLILTPRAPISYKDVILPEQEIPLWR